jgi:DNA-binding FadR family transcriptional regulator
MADSAPGLVGGAIGAITRHIRDNDLMPGDRLPSEAQLSRDLNVSRTVVREAFRSLAAVRIIELGAGRRAVVAPIDHGPMSLIIEHGLHTDQINVQQVYDVRRTIEARVAALAALRRREDEARDLVTIATGMRSAVDDPALLMEMDLAFHIGLARASRNPVFVLILGALQGITRQTWPIGWRSRTTDAGRAAMLAAHADIATAVAQGDPVAATAAMTRHFDESVRALIAAGVA